ncbi:hypothetical protein AB0M02_23700 [Actinoplanes sp. NPDC051861]|uniref:hypothetical protein n=1 Tax=Actinoplanes sp. NPDC051861 TaxID=3155170 RepID=UPI00343262DB
MRIFDRRPLLIIAGWLLAAALAVAVGVVGIGLVGAGLTSRQGAPITETQAERELTALRASAQAAAAPGTATSRGPGESAGPGGDPGAGSSAGPGVGSSAGPGSTPSGSSNATVGNASKSFPTRGGTVVADCSRIISMSPAQGFAVHEQDDDEGEFRSSTDPHDRIEVDLECVAGLPELRVQAKIED